MTPHFQCSCSLAKVAGMLQSLGQEEVESIIAERGALLDSGVRDPFSIVMSEVRSPTEAVIDGRETILVGTYNYMGMTFDPDVIQAGVDAIQRFGAGTTGSRVLNGTYQGHKEVEQALIDFYGMKHAIVFSTGYQANLGMVATLAGKGEYVILDADKSGVRRAEIIVRVLDKTICVHAEEDNMYKAIDAMLDKVERQLKKENEKLKIHKSVPVSSLAG